MAARPPGGPIFLVAGEPSGDQLGGRLMAALKRQARAQGGRELRFLGVGGERMAGEGLESLFAMSELSVMGLTEVLPHLRRILARMRETEAAARQARPAVFVSIDSPGFSLRVARHLAGQPGGSGFPLVHYVAPSVWAWKPWRAARIARYLDHLLCLLPFEPPYFERHGLPASFVGHPAIEALAEAGDGPGFRARHGLPAEGPLLCVLPGSRMGEVSRLLPLFGATLGHLARSHPALRVVVPTVAGVAAAVRAGTAAWPLPALVVEGAAEKYGAFAASRAALAASGTVAVELAVAGVPTVIGYRVSPISAAIARRMIKVKYVSIPNLVLDRPVMPEFLQDACTPERLAGAVGDLLDDGPARAAQVAGLAEAVALLAGAGAGSPSEQAARIVLRVAGLSG
ncbi:lipid-A-disaccharide synthase [Tistlia consotensis]|uniref:Lipid-A-disaccharide synthase n=1 Tax=Tistlia consotensis USBA 355 TaxID=560819 RepID=A0A1Y6CK22_9PROT|nr:lipid-A-disaccharide synthase [Tistlia consotensis]SMF70568.1 lipid-A-disaccharide synthase [Tistlia consotensis USBA 355]SNS04747.1 lipid-A-disaccharide synthase [Tistlia consotensis]